MVPNRIGKGLNLFLILSANYAPVLIHLSKKKILNETFRANNSGILSLFILSLIHLLLNKKATYLTFF